MSPPEEPASGPDGPPGGETGPRSPRGEGVARRDFFREGFQNLFQAFSRVVGEKLERFQLPSLPAEPSRGAAEAGGAAAAGLEGRLLRPPGALKEDLFAGRCERSGECVTACPVQAIRPLATEDARLHGTPFIDPSLQACVVCEGLHCMKVCPSGALTLLPRHLIAMGLAELHEPDCLRSTGGDCRICVDKCPLGPSALQLSSPGGRVEVLTGGCVGCGVCEMVCPTSPKAIVVRAR
jgi:ferredoxin-type protein NapG